MKSLSDHKNMSIEQLNGLLKNTLCEHLGMVVTELGTNYLKMRMPVERRTMQPMGTLDGGASLALAESAGSIASQLVVEKGRYCVGLEINANHIRSVKEGYVTATARPLHLGNSTQVWEVKIENDEGQLVCVSRLTMAVMETKKG
jgi:1,4-dihydroxy-2-naphthoyl-CoA hydrolase